MKFAGRTHGSDVESSAESIARLQQLGDLVKQGILTEDEFAAQKAKVPGA